MHKDKINIETSRFPRIAAGIYGNSDHAILLLHGFPATGNLWREIIPALAENYSVIVPDLPGVGNSDMGQEAVSIEELADGMAALMDQAGISRALIAGHSMGGYIALAMAEQHPGKVAGLSLIHSTATADSEEKKDTRRKSIALIQKGGKERFIEASVDSLFAPSFKTDHPAIIRDQIRESQLVPQKTLVSFYEAMINRPDRTTVLKNAHFPVQWIIGEDDKVVPKENSLPQSSLPGVSFVAVYKNCGHMSMLEQPARLTDNLKIFADYCYVDNRKIH